MKSNSFKLKLLSFLRRFCSNFSFFQLAKGIEANAKLNVLYPEQNLHRSMPIILETQNQTLLKKYFEERLTVKLADAGWLEYKNGWINKDGSHISPNNRLISEISLHYAQTIENHPALNSLRSFRSCYRHRGCIISLTGKGYYNYYHWMTEIFPKWELLKTQAIKDSANKETTIYAPDSLPFQRRTLELLQETFPQSDEEKPFRSPIRILSSDKHPLVRADKILAAGIPLPPGDPHPWAIDFVRSFFLQRIPLNKPSSTEVHRKIFISRQNAQTRRIVNFNDIETWCGKNGFKIIELEKMTLDEQINCFRTAEFIIAPHGAGLTNLIFAAPQAKVIEIIGNDRAHPEPHCFWAIADILKLNYAVLPSEIIPHPQKPHEKNYIVDIGSLNLLVEKM